MRMNTMSRGLYLIVMFCFALAAYGQSDSRLNVLMIAVDDLRPTLGCYGDRLVNSPHIDQLAASGMVFQRAYCQQAVCAPSRASLMSGLRPDSTGIFDLKTPLRKVRPHVLTMPQHFRENGYATVSLGKIYHHVTDDNRVGWSTPAWRPLGSWKGRGYLTAAAQKQIDSGYRKGVGVGPALESADVKDDQYPDGQVARKAIEWLQRFKKNDQTFYLAVGFVKPHLPFNAPRRYWDRYDQSRFRLPQPSDWPKGMPDGAGTNWGELRGYTDIPDHAKHLSEEQSLQLIHGYYACVSYIDALIGQVMAELDRLGLRENTVIVLWGDHGWKLDDYGAWCKHTNFEIDTRVPLIVSAPGFPGGKKTNALVELVDLYPTLCALTGLAVPKHCEGLSMAPLLSKPNRQWKQAVFSQYPRGNKIMRYSMRTERWRYCEWRNKADGRVLERELYDQTDGPLVTENLARDPAYAKTIEHLSQIMDGGKGWKKIRTQVTATK